MEESTDVREIREIDYLDPQSGSMIKILVTQLIYTEEGVTKTKFRFSDIAQNYEIRRLHGDFWEQLVGDMPNTTLHNVGLALRANFET